MAFRAYTRSRALELGLTGRARNLTDGRVEIVCCGDSEKVDALCKWLWQGPRYARVDSVRCNSAPPAPFSGFEIS